MAQGKLRFGRYDYASFLTLFSYAAGSLAIPLSLVAMSNELGFPLEHGGMNAGGLLHLVRSIAIMLSLLVCGFFSLQWGKRRSLGYALLFIVVGLALVSLAPSYTLVVIALLIAGLGEGFIEGLATPFVQELHPAEPGRYINFTHGFWSVGTFVTVLLGGGLLALGVNWRYIILGVSIVSLIPLGILLLPTKNTQFTINSPTQQIRKRTSIKSTIDNSKKILRSPSFWLFFIVMFVAGGGEFCLTFWTASYIQINFKLSAWSAGLGLAAFSLGMVSGRTLWGHFIHQSGLCKLIIFSAIGGTIITIILPFVTTLWLLLIVLLIAGFATAPFWPSTQSYCVERHPELDSTMLYIWLSCAGVPGAGFFTWLMGFSADRLGSLEKTFFLVPLCYIILAILMLIERTRKTKANA